MLCSVVVPSVVMGAVIDSLLILYIFAYGYYADEVKVPLEDDEFFS